MSDVETLTGGWEPETPVDDSILRQFVYAYAERVTWMAGVTGGRVDRDAAVCIAGARSAFGYDNAAVLLQPPSSIDLVDVLKRASVLFGPNRCWVLLSAWPLPELGSHGLSLVGHPPLMLRLPPAPALPRPPRLRIAAVEDTSICDDFDRVLKEGYDLPDSSALTNPRLLGHHLRLFVGYLDDRLVATAGACSAGGVVEVDWVATLLLLASDDGHNLHRRLGFIDLLRFTIWSTNHNQPTPKGKIHDRTRNRPRRARGTTSGGVHRRPRPAQRLRRRPTRVVPGAGRNGLDVHLGARRPLRDRPTLRS